MLDGVILCEGGTLSMSQIRRSPRNALVIRESRDTVSSSGLDGPQHGFLATDVAPHCRREEDTPRRQRDLISLRISVASTRRPALTSASDSRKAA